MDADKEIEKIDKDMKNGELHIEHRHTGRKRVIFDERVGR